MITAQRTGAFISGLRKARDWTQLELAEKLLVTHQAVSQWETGASFPDVGLLPQLARLFGVSVDDLLEGQAAAAPKPVSSGAMLEALARGNPDEVARMVQNDPNGVDMMLKTAPLARPSQLNSVVSQLSGSAFSVSQVLGLAPFVSPAVLGGLVDQMGAAQLSWETVAGLAPFVGIDRLDQMLQRMEAGAPDWDKLCGIAPFVSQPALIARLHKQLPDGAALSYDHLSSLAPYLGRATLDELMPRLPTEAPPMDFVLGMAPFIGEAALDRLITRLEAPAKVADHLSELAPFLSREALARAVAQARGHLSAADLVSLAPFLDQETLEAHIRPAAA